MNSLAKDALDNGLMLTAEMLESPSQFSSTSSDYELANKIDELRRRLCLIRQHLLFSSKIRLMTSPIAIRPARSSLILNSSSSEPDLSSETTSQCLIDEEVLTVTSEQSTDQNYFLLRA